MTYETVVLPVNMTAQDDGMFSITIMFDTL